MAEIYYFFREAENNVPAALYRCVETSDRFSTAFLAKGEWHYAPEFFERLENLHEGVFCEISDEEAAKIALLFGGEIDLSRTDEKSADKLIDAENRHDAFTETTMPQEEANYRRRGIKQFYETRKRRAGSIPTPPGIEKLTERAA